MPLLLHGVLAARDRDAITADELADDAPADVELVADGRLVAAVSPTDDLEAVPSRANLLGHARVVEHLGERATVAPMRFGVVVEDRDALVAGLRSRHDHLLEVLARLEGHREFRLRATYDEDAVVRAVLAEDPRAARLRGAEGFDARVELGERVVAGIEARRDADRARALEALEPHVADAVVEDVAEPLAAFALSLLVATDRQKDFDAALDGLGEELAPVIGLELVGPMPPFSFATA